MSRSKSYSIYRMFPVLLVLLASSCSKPFPDGDFLPLQLLEGTVTPPPIGGGNTNKYIFLTSASHQGDLGGVSGADSICQAAKPTDAPDLPGLDSEYKALLAGTGRVPGGAGWPLVASTNYYAQTPGDVLVFHTNAGGLPVIPLDSGVPGSSLNYWTGLDLSLVQGFSCSDWGSNSSALDADYGVSGDTTIGAFNNVLGNPCDTPNMKLLCVRN